MADLQTSEAKAWMVKSWRDLEIARRAATGEPSFYDIAVYHCQQSAEKAVKAFLVHHGNPRLTSLNSVLSALGLKIIFEAA